MSSLVLLLLWTCGWFLRSSQEPTAQPVYPEPVVPDVLNKPEAVYYPVIPFHFWEWYESLPRRVEFQAHLFAGKAEFPYVVWIKAPQQIYCEDEDQIFNKVLRRFAGVIVSWNVIMTACHKLVVPVCTQHNKSSWPIWPEGKFTLDDPIPYTIPLWPGVQVKKDIIMCPEMYVRIDLCDSHLFEVHFATVYLPEDNKYTDQFGYYVMDNDNKYAGRRTVIQTLVHPQCKPHKSLLNDVGFILLDAPIVPAGTWVSTALFPITTHNSFDDIDLDEEYIHTHVCYIAAFNELYAGMPYNDGRQITRDYKVKFRTYQTGMLRCIQFAKILCYDTQLVFVRGCWSFLKLKWENMGPAERKSTGLECWETRHKVGAVCDIHSGAPLVCNGLVYGHVIRGADDNRCNINVPVPFFVQRNFPDNIQNYLSFVHQLLRDPLEPPILPVQAYQGRSNTPRTINHSQNILFMLACFIPYSASTVTF